MLFYLFLSPPCLKQAGLGWWHAMVTQQVTGLRSTPTFLLPLPFLWGLCSPCGHCCLSQGWPPRDSSGTEAPQHCPQKHPKHPPHKKNTSSGGQVEGPFRKDLITKYIAFTYSTPRQSFASLTGVASPQE